MKILLLGANGQLGWELRRSLAVLGELVACSRQDADLSRPDSLPALVAAVQPDVVVNAAAHTAVDQAEAEPGLARTLNATAVGVLAHEARQRGICLVHYSTDYVFDGGGSSARAEDASTGPLNVYGRSKLEGEELIRASGCHHAILRTSWVYAARGGNFVRTMLRLAAEREELKVIADQTGAPTGAELLADVTAQLLPRLFDHVALSGTYHCVAAGETTWHAYASHVIERARARGQPVRVAPDRIHPIPTSAYPTPAQRPLNSRLDTHKLRSTFGLTLPPWQQGVDRLLAEILG
jgi:dTDP-4-dehydrorhamnose reductase